MSISRSFHGAHVKFGAGGTVSSLQLDQPILVNDHVSVNVDANGIIVVFNSTEPEPDLTRFGALYRLSSVRIHRGDSSLRILCAVYERPEHAITAIQSLPRATLVYRLSFVMRTIIAHHTRDKIENIKTKYLNEEFVWIDNYNEESTALTVTGIIRANIAKVKTLIEAILVGSIATRRDPEQMPGEIKPAIELCSVAFTSTIYQNWLAYLGRRSAALILPDFEQLRLYIYGRGRKHTNAIETRLARVISGTERHRLFVDKTFFEKAQSPSYLSQLHSVFGSGGVDLDTANQAVIIRCTKYQVPQAARILGLLPQGQRRSCGNCGMLLTEVKSLSCGHHLCPHCFKHQIRSALNGFMKNHFPLRCWSEDCAKPIQINDLRGYISGQQMDELLKASLKQFIRLNTGFYSYCRTPDCSSVYAPNASGTRIVHVCHVCLALTCLQCGHEPHPNVTCQAHKMSLKSSSPTDYLPEDYTENAAHNTKNCPRCKTLLEMGEGCYHMECGACGTHICWHCLKTFDSTLNTVVHIAEDHPVDTSLRGWVEEAL